MHAPARLLRHPPGLSRHPACPVPLLPDLFPQLQLTISTSYLTIVARLSGEPSFPTIGPLFINNSVTFNSRLVPRFTALNSSDSQPGFRRRTLHAKSRAQHRRGHRRCQEPHPWRRRPVTPTCPAKQLAQLGSSVFYIASFRGRCQRAPAVRQPLVRPQPNSLSCARSPTASRASAENLVPELAEPASRLL